MYKSWQGTASLVKNTLQMYSEHVFEYILLKV